MSTLSQFFGSSGVVSELPGSVLNIVTSTKSVTIPSTALYAAYGAIGAGAGGVSAFYTGVGYCNCGGAGGGFSYSDGAISGGPTTACAVIGAGGLFAYACCSTVTNCCGGATTVTGISVGDICARGGGCTCSTPGCGLGGQINTCGGIGSPNSCCSSGGGAGGVIGNGGAAGCGTATSSGGGFGGGGGGGNCGAFGGAGLGPSTSTMGGNGLCGTGAVAGYMATCAVQGIPATGGYIPQYTITGRFSQAKTFFAAAGGGSATGAMCSSATLAQPAAPGGGGSCCGSAGFGGGGGTQSAPSFGGGSAYCTGSYNCAGGSGIAIIEYWTV